MRLANDTGYPFSGENPFEKQQQSKETNKILIVSNLPSDTKPDIIFWLFSLYGNVQKVKVMFKKWDTALIEFQDYLQANQAKLYLNGCPLFGNEIKVNKSKSLYIKIPA